MPVAGTHGLGNICRDIMTNTYASEPLLGLVDAIEEHTRHQQALIDCVRSLREFLVSADNPGPTPDALNRLTAPPPPVSQTPSYLIQAPPPTAPQLPIQAPPPLQAPPLLPVPSAVLAPPAVQVPVTDTPTDAGSAELDADSPPQQFLRTLKRDYDYFAELDEKLARLSTDLSAEDGDPVDGWPETGAN